MRYFRKLEVASLHLYLSKMGLLNFGALVFQYSSGPVPHSMPPATRHCGALVGVEHGALQCHDVEFGSDVPKQLPVAEDFAGKVGDVTS